MQHFIELAKKVVIPRFYKQKKGLPLKRPDAARRVLDPLIDFLRQWQLPVIWVIGLPTRRIVHLRRQYCRTLAEGLGFTYLSLDEQLMKWKERDEGTRNATTQTDRLSRKPRKCPLVNYRLKKSVDVELKISQRLGLSKTLYKQSHGCENREDISGRKITNQHTNRIKFKMGEAFSREQILDLLKFAMIESIPTKGFVIENFPYDPCDALNFESLFYPVLLGIYLTESTVLENSNPKDLHNKIRADMGSRSSYAFHPEIELVTPKYTKRIKEFSFREAELVCENYATKLIRIINAEVVKPETFSFVHSIVENCLERYPNGCLDFGDDMPNALIEYFDSPPRTRLTTDAYVVVRADSANLTPPGTVQSRRSTPLVHSRTESSGISTSGRMTAGPDTDGESYGIKPPPPPETRAPSLMWVQYSASSSSSSASDTETLFYDYDDGAGDVPRPTRIQIQNKKFTAATDDLIRNEKEDEGKGEGSINENTKPKSLQQPQPLVAVNPYTVPARRESSSPEDISMDWYKSNAESGEEWAWEPLKISTNDVVDHSKREENLQNVLKIDDENNNIITPTSKFSANVEQSEVVQPKRNIESESEQLDRRTDDVNWWEETNSDYFSAGSSPVPITASQSQSQRTLSHLMTVAQIFGQSSSNEDPESSRRNRSRGRSPIRRKRYSNYNSINPLNTRTGNGKQNIKQNYLTRQSKSKQIPLGDMLSTECDRGDLGSLPQPDRGIVAWHDTDESPTSRQSTASLRILNNERNKFACRSLPNLASIKPSRREGANNSKSFDSTKLTANAYQHVKQISSQRKKNA